MGDRVSKSFRLSLAVFLGVFASTEGGLAARPGLPGPQMAAGEFVVKIKVPKGSGVRAHGASQTRVLHALSVAMGVNNVVESARPLATQQALTLMKVARNVDSGQAMATLRRLPDVEYVEPNYIYRASAAIPNDPQFGKTWGLLNGGQPDPQNQKGKPGSDIRVLPMWDQGFVGSRRVVVAVIDTGVDWTHPDLAANLYTNPGEVPGDGIDNDRNGFVDDVHGWNFAGKNNNSNDDNSHGTHCSGTIGGVGNNGVGVAGVNWQVSIMPLKFLSAQGGGRLSDALEAINYARMMKVNVMSNSWGGGGYSKALEDAIRAASEEGILFVAAAGNETNDNDAAPTFPAGYKLPNVISVAAVDNQDRMASFSNWGKTTVDVAAPGVNIWSSTPGGNYASYSGTSMATPHVAGIAALMISANPGLRYTEIKRRLVDYSDPVPGLAGRVVANGRVNTWDAFRGSKAQAPAQEQAEQGQWKYEPINMQSPHPYGHMQSLLYEISRPGAKAIRLHFKRLDVEAGYDYVGVYDGKGRMVDDLTGTQRDYWTSPIAGDAVRVMLKSDESRDSWGFYVDGIWIQQ